VVALKLLRQGAASRQAMKRFRHETEILGRLKHPNIAQIHDAGTFDSGQGAQPYFAMEFVNGRPLVEYAEEQKLDIRDRLRLFVSVCDALQYAHLKGVIHRDLKPDNILVDNLGEPKILDFGVARVTDADIQVTTLQTDIGQLIGTVPYMSPEQCDGDPTELDIRSDVYSLGVVLYELLSGRLPHDLAGRNIPDAVRIIHDDDPTPLSSINRVYRGDIETIVAKTLEKDKARRYQSAAELAADLRRYLADEPILARPASTFYQLGKFARRNKTLVAGTVAVIAVLAAGVATTSWQAIQASRREAQATAYSDFVMWMLALANPEEMQQVTETPVTFRRATSLVDLMDQAGPEIDVALALWPEKMADVHERFALNYRGYGELRKWRHHFQRAYDIRRDVMGADHEITLRTLSRLAACEIELGLLEDADRMEREAIEGLTRVLGKEHRDTLIAVRRRANSLGLYQGREGEALTLLQETLATMRQRLDPTDPEIVRTASKLAALLLSWGKLGEAEDIAREWLEIAKRTLDDDHYLTWQLTGQLGMIRLNRGDAVEAERLLRQTRAAMIEKTGRVSRETLRFSFFLAKSLAAQERDDECDQILTQIVEDARTQLGEDHFHTWLNVAQVGVHRKSQGRLKVAEGHFQDAITGYARVLGADHWRTLVTRCNLGIVQWKLGQFEDAERQFRRAIKGQLRVRGKDHPQTLTTRYELAQLLDSRGKSNEAQQHYRELLAGLHRAYGPEHEYTLEAVNALAWFLKDQGSQGLAEAASLARDGTDICVRQFGDENQKTLAIRDTLAVVLHLSRENEKAIIEFDKSAAAARKMRGEDRWFTAMSSVHYGRCLLELARFGDSESVLITTYSGYRELNGQDHEETQSALAACIDLYDAWGKPEKAAEYRALLPETEEDVKASD
ncbi:MAG: tetratricopeptide repeat protein, partial [Phycisphaerales bacterium]